MVTNGHGYLVREILKSAVSKEWVYELSCFLHAEYEAVSFGLTNIIFYIFYRLLYHLLNANLLQLYLSDP